MTKELKNYLPLYIGCDVLDPNKTISKLIGVVDNEAHFIHYETGQYGFCSINSAFFGKIILRPLRTLTDEEASELYNLQLEVDEGSEMECADYFRGNPGFYEPLEFHFLLSKHFDLFGLIEAGIAIDSTTLPTT